MIKKKTGCSQAHIRTYIRGNIPSLTKPNIHSEEYSFSGSPLYTIN